MAGSEIKGSNEGRGDDRAKQPITTSDFEKLNKSATRRKPVPSRDISETAAEGSRDASLKNPVTRDVAKPDQQGPDQQRKDGITGKQVSSQSEGSTSNLQTLRARLAKRFVNIDGTEKPNTRHARDVVDRTTRNVARRENQPAWHSPENQPAWQPRERWQPGGTLERIPEVEEPVSPTVSGGDKSVRGSSEMVRGAFATIRERLDSPDRTLPKQQSRPESSIFSDGPVMDIGSMGGGDITIKEGMPGTETSPEITDRRKELTDKIEKLSKTYNDILEQSVIVKRELIDIHYRQREMQKEQDILTKDENVYSRRSVYYGRFAERYEKIMKQNDMLKGPELEAIKNSWIDLRKKTTDSEYENKFKVTHDNDLGKALKSEKDLLDKQREDLKERKRGLTERYSEASEENAFYQNLESEFGKKMASAALDLEFAKTYFEDFDKRQKIMPNESKKRSDDIARELQERAVLRVKLAQNKNTLAEQYESQKKLSMAEQDLDKKEVIEGRIKSIEGRQVKNERAIKLNEYMYGEIWKELADLYRANPYLQGRDMQALERNLYDA